MLTKAWAIEYAKYKIRVNCVCPGIVETDMTQPYLENEIDRSMAVAEHPIGRIGVPEECCKGYTLPCFRGFFVDYRCNFTHRWESHHKIITLIKLIEPNLRL